MGKGILDENFLNNNKIIKLASNRFQNINLAQLNKMYDEELKKREQEEIEQE